MSLQRSTNCELAHLERYVARCRWCATLLSASSVMVCQVLFQIIEMKHIKSKPAYNPQNMTKAADKTSHCLLLYYAHAHYALSFIILI